MEHIIRALGFLLIPVIVNGVLAFLSCPRKAEKGKVYLPKFFVILGSITSAAFLIPTLITAFSGESIWIPLIFFIFSLFGASFIVAFVNCRISYDKNGFVVKNFWGIKRKYRYGQVTAIKENMHETYIYIGKRRIMVDALAIGGLDFISYVNTKYEKLHDGERLPKIFKTKYDIFNGNIYDAAGFVFVYIFIGIAAIVFLIFAVYLVLFAKSTPDNTAERQLSFKSCRLEGDDIILISSDDITYKIRFADIQFDTEKLKAICDGKTVVSVYTSKISSDKGEDYYSVRAILYNETYILSFEETDRFLKQEYWPLIAIAVIINLVWGVFVSASVIVGRNPKKFSKKIVRLFFKDGYINKI